MTTPSRSHATSTPRPTSTPTRALASPHPAVTASLRGISHKSPAMKTPASTHGHSHTISTSSHPSSTPVTALAHDDDGLATNSPAAAFTPFLSAPALTPLPIPSNLHMPQAEQTTTHAVHETEVTRISRLREIVEALKDKVAGRGITRDGVERVAQLNGLTTLWDEDILTIAGNNYVDLEILFDSVQRDHVNDVSLKLKEMRQDEASEILKQDLSSTARYTPEEPWNTLTNFASNVSYLAQLDSLSVGVNCFEAIDGLYGSFKKVWEEDKKRLTWKTGLKQLYRGSIGRPSMNEKRKLGLTLEYWAEKQHPNSPAQSPRGTGHDLMTSNEECGKADSSTWAAHVSCEPGYPSLKVSQDWISSSILVEKVIQSEQDDDKEGSWKPDWVDPEPVVISGPEGKDENDAMEIDGTSITIPRTPNARFTFTFDPVLYLPLNVVLAFELKGLGMIAEESQIRSCPDALQQMVNPVEAGQPLVHDPGKTVHFSRKLVAYNREGQKRVSQHTYAVSSPPHCSNARSWCYPVERVAFTHPREVVELYPVFRQYALMWTLLQKLANKQSQPAEKNNDAHPIKKSMPKKRSNTDARQAELGNLLASLGLAVPGEHHGASIDVTIDFTGSAPALNPKLDLIMPLVGPATSGVCIPQLAFISIEIVPDADVRVIATQGLGFLDNEQDLLKMAKILTLSEDLSVLIEWVLEAERRGRENSM